MMDLASRLAALERQVARLNRSPRLGHSTLDGIITLRDPDGGLRGEIGRQWDDTYAVAAYNGPVPPTPSAPVLEPVLGGLRITWDGTFVDGAVSPMDFARVEAEITADGEWTRVGTIESPAGGTIVTRPDYVPHTARLIARSLSGVQSVPSQPSDAATPELAQAVDLAPGLIGGNALYNPGFDIASTSGWASGWAFSTGMARVPTGGRSGGPGVSLPAMQNADPGLRPLTGRLVPVAAGEVWRVGCWARSDSTVVEVLEVRAAWYDANKSLITEDQVSWGNDTTTAWALFDGDITVPQNAVWMAPVVRVAFDSPVPVFVDDASARRVEVTDSTVADLVVTGMATVEGKLTALTPIMVGYLVLNSPWAQAAGGGSAVPKVKMDSTGDVKVMGALATGGTTVTAPQTFASLPAGWDTTVREHGWPGIASDGTPVRIRITPTGALIADGWTGARAFASLHITGGYCPTEA